MGKLHELLAAEAALKEEAAKATGRIKSLFTDGRGRFTGQLRRYSAYQEGDAGLPDERTALSTSVGVELNSFWSSWGKWVDAAIQKEATNTITTADVVVDGKVILANLPAPALLNLESRLSELKAIYEAMPTNDPTEVWVLDENTGVWRTEPRITVRATKKPRAFVAYEATKEHPAQVQVYQEDVPVGTWSTTIFSGAVPETTKRATLARLDVLIRATKEARMRANEAVVVPVKVADAIWNYIESN